MTLKVLTKTIQRIKTQPVMKVNSYIGLKRLQGLWAKKPKTKQDLVLVREKLWS